MQDPTDNDRNECLKKAESCLEQAGQDVSRRTYWIQQAAEWIHRARGGGARDGSKEDATARTREKTGAVTHEVCDGHLVPKPTAK
ncbi:MAG: hypothetical protein WA702_30645 [Bradyrhizobium sp.]|jgi:hypothetical protein|uniref:hypothetical protein n=1 Tax=Bradyrhizobium sp. TaxID=376 RepID=UPI003C7E0A23